MDNAASLAAGIPVSSAAVAAALTSPPPQAAPAAPAPATVVAAAPAPVPVPVSTPAAQAPAAAAPAAQSAPVATMAVAAEVASALTDPTLTTPTPVVITVPGLTLDALPTFAQVAIKNYAQKGLVLVCAVLAAHGLPLSTGQKLDAVQIGSSVALFVGSCVWTWIASKAHAQQVKTALLSPPPAA